MLRQLRDEQDLSLREFAKKINCSPAFVSDVELGRRYPSEDVLIEMAKALKTSPGKLKEHDTRPPTEEMKERIAADPRFALAFRTIVDSKVSPDELIKFAKSRSEGRAKRK